MYEVHISQFDGPLDLLLHLIQEAEVDIRDIFVSEITAQYLTLMKEIDALDMDTASEFLTMAATLVYIKSRSLLPKPPREETPGEEDPEQQLIRQLQEYKAFREASDKLSALRDAASGAFTRLPEEFPLPPQEIIWTEVSPDALMKAFIDVLERQGSEPEERIELREVKADAFTVRSQLRMIRAALSDKGKVTFEELFTATSGKMEKIVTFMALLDMIMRAEIILRQPRPWAEITIEEHKLLSDDENQRYMDETEDEA